MKNKNNISSFTQSIRNKAIQLGFTGCGFAQVRELSDFAEKYNTWVSSGYNAGMGYMEKNIEKRINPALLVNNSKTIISLLYNYFTTDSLTQTKYNISKYAHGADYHDVITEKLSLLGSYIRTLAPDVEQRCFIDSAPVMERAWAQQAGLGWIGKNSCLISRKQGSFFYIAEIITSLELEYDKPGRDLCGNCTRCIDACPTKAIKEGRMVDSNLCISYQTIENKGEIPPILNGKFNNYIFGCDICQDVCPWNKFAQQNTEPEFQLNNDIKAMKDEDWYNLTEDKFRDLFRKSAIKRAKYMGLMRNIFFIEKNLPVSENKV